MTKLTLNRWRDFAKTPKTLAFPHLELLGRDQEPSIVVGAGEVRMTSPTDFTYKLVGTPVDVRYALSEINRHHADRYDGLSRLRLKGVDSDGINWSGGWTVPQIDTNGPNWIFTGRLEALSTIDQSETVAGQASTELIFPLRIGDPMTIAMARFARTRQPNGETVREHTIEALETSIRFAFEGETSTLLVTALHNPDLPAPYAENWLGEPLRILFGQLIFPCLVARNFGGGRSLVWVRPSPPLIPHARWASLFGRDDLVRDDSAFWSLYAQLLELIARARNNEGHPNFEAHKVTWLYEEVIQASRGSRWVWALTFASAIEALVNMIFPESAQPTELEANTIAALVKHINAGPGEARLKEMAVNAVGRAVLFTTRRALRDLRNHGIITKAQASAWEEIRNAVAHGSLLSRYSNKQEDAKLLTLASMMHALTRELVRRSAESLGRNAK